MVNTGWGIETLINPGHTGQRADWQGWSLLCVLLIISIAAKAYGAQDPVVPSLDDRQQVDIQLKKAAKLYSNREYAAAAIIYQRLSSAPNADQSAWALELYGVCMEQQGEHETALVIYDNWLAQYAGASGEIRVQQRRVALLTASAEPQSARRLAKQRSSDTQVYGSTSLMYRGLRRKVEDQDPETAVSSLAGDLDLHLSTGSGSFLWRSRISGGYLSDQSQRSVSDGRVSNLYVSLMHEPTGAELTVGRQRVSENGIYGYFDGASFRYPMNDLVTFSLLGGSVSTSSKDAPSNDHQAYGFGTEFHLADLGLRLQLYAMEQTYDGLTERRAVGGEVSYFNDFSHYLLIADYDTKFKEINNMMFNGSWELGDVTNLALSLGYQRSPFLSATNAVIGEFDVDLDRLVAELDDGLDIYDAALEKTALSRYASLVVNRQLSDSLRVIGEAFYYQLSDLPQYDPAFETPDSDVNTTLGLQLVWGDALFTDDILSTGVRYTAGDVANNATLFIDEKLRFDHGLDLTVRLSASRRWFEDLEQEAYTLRPGVRLDWYITPDFLLDLEFGYEWLLQEFQSDDFQVHQGFAMVGLRKRF